MPKKEKFPKQIFVTREPLASRETFLSASEDLDGISRLKITKTFK